MLGPVHLSKNDGGMPRMKTKILAQRIEGSDSNREGQRSERGKEKPES